MLGRELRLDLRTEVGSDLGELAAVQDADRGHRAHDGDLGARPGEDLGRAEGTGVHGDVCAAVGLASHQGDPGDHTLAEGVQELRAAAYDAVPLLADARQVAGDVDDDDQRYAEGVAEAYEPGGLLRREGVETAAESQRVVGDDADGATAEAAQGGDDVGCPASVQLLCGAFVEDVLDERVHVVGALLRLGQLLGEVLVLHGRDVEAALGAEERGDRAGLVERLALGLGEDVDDAGAAAVRLGATEAQHVDVLTGDGAYDVGAGHEDPALGAEDDDVGEGGTVRSAAGRRAEDDRDLRDLAAGLGHRVEDAADRVEGEYALGEPGAARVPQADDRDAVGHRAVIGVDDHAAAEVAHRAAHDGGVGAEGDRAGSLDLADGGQHAGIVVRGDERDGALVEERLQTGQRVARVLVARELLLRRAGRRRSRDRHQMLP